MKKKHKSIGTRIKNCMTFESQNKILTKWADSWEDDQNQLIGQLYDAVQKNDYNMIMHGINQFHILTDKRFTGLRTVIRVVSDPDRQLKNIMDDNKDAEEPEERVQPIGEPKSDSLAELFEEIVKCYNAGMSVKK